MWCVLLLVIVTLSTEFIAGQNPNCNEGGYFVENQYERSVQYVGQYGEDDFLCDVNLTPMTYYRFLSPAGDFIRRGCPRNVTIDDPSSVYFGETCGSVTRCCNSNSQLYLDETEELPGEWNESQLTGYVHYYGDCVAKSISFKVWAINCSDFMIYKWETIPSSCYYAFCVGNRYKCPPGSNSDDNFSPCYALVANETITPNITWQITKPDNPKHIPEYRWRCNWGKPQLINLGVAVQFLADGQPITNEEKMGPAKTDAVLEEKDDGGKDTWTMGQSISCRTRAYILNDPNQPPGLWKESDRHPTGMMFEETNYHFYVGDELEEEDKYQLRYKSTIPIPCDDNCLNAPLIVNLAQRPDIVNFLRSDCSDNETTFYPSMVFQSNCRTKFIHDNWNEWHNITIIGQLDEYVDTPEGINKMQYAITAFSPGTFGTHRHWDNYRFPVVHVHVTRNSSYQLSEYCDVFNDPHVSAFGGEIITAMVDGEHVLVRDNERDFQINGMFSNCSVDGPGTKCLCGVAVRHNRVVFVISRCRSNNTSTDAPLSLRVYPNHCEEIAPGFKVTTGTGQYGNKYDVFIPTGAHVTVQVNFYTQYFVQMEYRPSKHDHHRIQGLCGVYGESGRDALQGRNGTVIDSHDEFVQHWKADIDEEIMYGQAGDSQCWEVDETRFCRCFEDSTSGDVGLNCTAVPQTVQCVHRNHTNILPMLFEESRKLELMGTRPDAMLSVPLTQGSKLRKQLFAKEKQQGKKTLTRKISNEALCRQEIEDSELAAVSKGLVMDSDLENRVQACIKDLNLTGDEKWVDTALDSLATTVDKQLSQNLSMYEFSGNSSTGDIEIRAPSYITRNICPVNCKKHGECTDEGICECDDGFDGMDCSIDLNTAPLVTIIGYNGNCDRSRYVCDNAHMIGSGYGSTPLCHYRPEDGSAPFTRDAFVLSLSEARCPTPSRHAYDIYYIAVSNDGRLTSEEYTFISFDSNCMDCDVDREGFCLQKPATCLIERTCYFPNATKPGGAGDVACNYCDPDTDPLGWTKHDIAECAEGNGNSTLVILGSVLGLAMVGIVAAGLIAVGRQKHHQRHHPSIQRDSVYSNPEFVNSSTCHENLSQNDYVTAEDLAHDNVLEYDDYDRGYCDYHDGMSRPISSGCVDDDLYDQVQ